MSVLHFINSQMIHWCSSLFFLGNLSQFLDNLGSDQRVWFSNTASMGLTSLVEEKNCHVAVTCVTHAKAIKNETELKGKENTKRPRFRRMLVREIN